MRSVAAIVVCLSAVLSARAQDGPAPKGGKTAMKLRKAPEDAELPKVIRVDRATPVFAGPSPKKKILADVDPGTQLIARGVSPKGSWLSVEDEDGNKGWIPVNRTNYRTLAPPTEIVDDDEIENAVEEENERALKVPPLGRLVVAESLLSNHGYGASASVLVLQSQDSPLDRERRIGLEVGAYRDWSRKVGHPRSVTLPILVRMMAREAGSGFFSGPDIGAQYRFRDRSWGGEVGYSVGWGAKSRAGLQTRGRASVEWGGKTRYLATWGFGWVF